MYMVVRLVENNLLLTSNLLEKNVHTVWVSSLLLALLMRLDKSKQVQILRSPFEGAAALYRL